MAMNMEKVILALVIISIVVSAASIASLISVMGTLSDMKQTLSDINQKIAGITNVTATVIAGQIKDANGNPVAGVDVTLGGLKSTTGSNGAYSFNVVIGNYTLIVSKTGYRTGQQSINAAEAKTYSVNVTLEKLMIFYFRHTTDEQSIDPAQAPDTQDYFAAFAAYDRLIDFKPNSTDIEGSLATSWEINPNATVYTFHLRPNVLFADGTPFNASCVQYSFARLLAIGQQSANFLSIKSIDVVDDLTVRFTLNYSFAPFLMALTDVHGGIVSPSGVAAHNSTSDPWAMNWFSEFSDGTGPYQQIENIRRDHWTLARNPYYWKGWEGKHLDQIVISVVTEATTAYMQLAQGTLDAARMLDISIYKQAIQQPGIQSLKWLAPNGKYFWFNCQKYPTDDINIRKAIAYAIDYDSILQAVGIELQARQTTALFPMIWGYDPTMPYYTRNLTLARYYLSQSKYPECRNGSFTIEAFVENDPTVVNLNTVFQASLADIGITCVLDIVDWSVIAAQQSQVATAKSWCTIGQYAFYPDPHNELYTCFATAAWGPVGRNWAYYSNATLDSLLDQASKITDQTQRAAMYRQIALIVYQDCPAAPVYQRYEHVEFHDWVKGMTYYPMETETVFGNYYNIYIEGRPGS